MDILILNWKDLRNPDVGGAEIILYELARRLVREGHTVTWFCRTYPGCKPKDVVDGINIVRRGNKLTVYWEAYRYYQSLAHKPDKVVDCINTICWQTPLYVPAEHRIAYVNQLAREVLFYELPPIISHLAYMLEPLEYASYRRTKFLCYAASVKKDVTHMGIPEKNISVFPLGVDHKRYKPGTKSKDPLFIFVGRLAAMKRPELCVDAMRIIVKRYKSAKLAIIGYGPQEERLSSRIKKYNLDNNVFLVNKNHLFFDYNPKDVKVRLMQQAWALLLPSVKEGWGMVVTEAAACATPSVVTRVTGLTDSVVEDKTGIVISQNPDIAELANALEKLIKEQALRLRMSRQAAIRAKTFTWEMSYEQFYKHL